MQEIGGASRVGGGAENRALVFLRHLKPVPEVGGMVVAYLRRDAKIGAQKGRARKQP